MLAQQAMEKTLKHKKVLEEARVVLQQKYMLWLMPLVIP